MVLQACCTTTSLSDSAIRMSCWMAPTSLAIAPHATGSSAILPAGHSTIPELILSSGCHIDLLPSSLAASRMHGFAKRPPSAQQACQAHLHDTHHGHIRVILLGMDTLRQPTQGKPRVLKTIPGTVGSFCRVFVYEYGCS